MPGLHRGHLRPAAFAGAALVVAATALGTGQAAADTLGGERLASPTSTVLLQPGADPLPAVKAATWILADAETGEVLAQKGSHVQRAPASTLKMLTALTVLPRTSPETEYVATSRAAYIYGARVGPEAGQGVHDGPALVRGVPAQRQRRRHRRGRGQWRRAPDGAPDERCRVRAAGPRHRREEHERPRRTGPGVECLRPGPDRPRRPRPRRLREVREHRHRPVPRRQGQGQPSDLHHEPTAAARLARRHRRQDRLHVTRRADLRGGGHGATDAPSS